MDKNENSEAAGTKEKRVSCDLKSHVVIFIILPIILTTLFPLGGLYYLSGRFTPSSIGYACTLYHVVGGFIIYCFFAGIIRLLDGWEKHAGQEKFMLILEIVIPLLFVVFFILPSFLPDDSDICWRFYKPFTYGFRDRMRANADVEVIRDWLETFSKKDFTGHEGPSLHSDKWPKSVKALKPRSVSLFMDDNGNPNVRLIHAGGGFIGNTGVEIGMADMDIPPSDFSYYGEYRLPVEPGVYVWHQLQ